MVTKTGFDAAALIPDIPRLLERGGMLSMLNTVLLHSVRMDLQERWQ